jgi:hypothetical protein
LSLLRSLIGFLLAASLHAQNVDVRVYSEFRRIGPDGRVIAADRGGEPIETISPGVVRNGYATFRVAVTGAPGTPYAFYIQTNPENVFQFNVYKEASPNSIVKQADPTTFTATLPTGTAATITDTYLMDVFTPATTTGGRVRVEVWVKAAGWRTAPMEFRILHAKVPPVQGSLCCATPDPPQRSADATAWSVLLRGLKGGKLPSASAPDNVGAIAWRNAAQDVALLSALDPKSRAELVRFLLPLLFGRAFPGLLLPDPGPEAYLRVRQRIYRLASEQAAGATSP